MQFDMRSLPLGDRYKLLNSTITPRPIAWVTSLSREGVVNAAPYSFFNAVGVAPPLVVLGLLKDMETLTLKNTAANIVATNEFVVNLVREDDMEKMNNSSVPAPPEVSELDYAGIAVLPSVVVAPPRIATSPVSFECRKVMALDVGTAQTVIIGEILMTHIEDRFITNLEKHYLDTPAMRLVGRTHGGGWYVRNTDRFQLKRPQYDAEWRGKREPGAGGNGPQ